MGEACTRPGLVPRGFVIARAVTFLDDFFTSSTDPLAASLPHQRRPHLCLAPLHQRRIGVKNIVRYTFKGRSPERVIAGSSNKSMEPVCTFARSLEALSGFKNINSRVISEVRWSALSAS